MKQIPIIYLLLSSSSLLLSSWFKYEINSIIYTLSFLVIYNSNRHFYKCPPNTQLFQKTLFNNFTKRLAFWKNPFSYRTFWNWHFFKKHSIKKLNQTQECKCYISTFRCHIDYQIACYYVLSYPHFTTTCP